MLNFKIVQFSDRLVNEYYTLVQKNRVRMPEIPGAYRNPSKRVDRSSTNFI